MDGTYQQEMMARHLAKDGLSLYDFDDGRLMLGGNCYRGNGDSRLFREMGRISQICRPGVYLYL
ncbi:hypothetical protein C1J05_11755 [Sulfitobacter sp. JL08]|nr:hypothetical protein C1J05_11755 [Sulfitobacter sp. JL08]